MQSKNKVFLVGLLFLIIGCGGENVEDSSEVEIIENPAWSALQNSENQPIIIEEVQTFGSSEFEGDAIVYSAASNSGITVDENQNLYLVDNRDNKLISFNPNGELIWKVGSRGQGPGDIHEARGLDIYKNRILVSNNNGSRIDEFDMDGNFVQTHDLDEIGRANIILCGITETGKVILSSYVPLKIGVHIFVLDVGEQLTLENDFMVTFGEKDYLTSLGVFTLVDGNEIVIRNGLDFGFTYYDVGGNKVKEVRRDLDTFVRPGNYKGGKTERAFMPMSGGIGPYRISDSLLIGRISWPVNVSDPDEAAKYLAVNRRLPKIEREHAIDLHQGDGALLYSIKSTETEVEFPIPHYADGMGYFYTVVTSPYMHIKKYSVKLAR